MFSDDASIILLYWAFSCFDLKKICGYSQLGLSMFSTVSVCQLRNADPASPVRMSWSVIPSVFNNMISVLWASLYQRNRALAFFSGHTVLELAPGQFIFLLAKPCEVWLGSELQVGGGAARPDKTTDRDPAQHSGSRFRLDEDMKHSTDQHTNVPPWGDHWHEQYKQRENVNSSLFVNIWVYKERFSANMILKSNLGLKQIQLGRCSIKFGNLGSW